MIGLVFAAALVSQHVHETKPIKPLHGSFYMQTDVPTDLVMPSVQAAKAQARFVIPSDGQTICHEDRCPWPQPTAQLRPWRGYGFCQEIGGRCEYLVDRPKTMPWLGNRPTRPHRGPDPEHAEHQD